MHKKKPNPAHHRNKWLRCRVNEVEEAAVQNWLHGITADDAELIGAAITARIQERAPFATTGALLRAIFDLEPISVGAPVGNQNKLGKRKAS